MVAPVRGIAWAFRLEYARGLEPADADFNRGNSFQSRGDFAISRGELDRLGEASLKRAVKILESNESREGGGNTGGVLVETLLELGDWYQMADERKLAARTWRRAWDISQAHLDGHETLFDQPQPILFRSPSGVMLRPVPRDHSGFRQYWADIDYTVDRLGRVRDVKVGESNAPKSLRRHLVDSLTGMRYRPRFVDGKPVDTHHVHSRQTLWFEKQTLFRVN
jgi:hypothetical protein